MTAPHQARFQPNWGMLGDQHALTGQGWDRGVNHFDKLPNGDPIA